MADAADDDSENGEPKGLPGIKVLLPVLKLVGVVCASRMRLVTNSP